MIITDKFVWFHLPKTAGTNTRKLLSQFYIDDIIYNSVGINSVNGQAHISEIPDEFQDLSDSKDWIINFRKLPFWLISHINHEARSTKYTGDLSRSYALSCFKSGRNLRHNLADQTLSNFMPVFDRLSPTVRGRVIVIKQEYYNSCIKDVLSLYETNRNLESYNIPQSLKIDKSKNLHPHFVDMYRNISKSRVQKIDANGLDHFLSRRRNYHPESTKNLLYDDIDIPELSNDDIDTIYRNNPYWARLEQTLYGETFPKFLQK